MLQRLNGMDIDFQGSVLGFSELNHFFVQVIDEEQQFAYLQSKEDENIGFLVTNPFVFHKQYQFSVDESEKQALGIQSPEHVLVLAIVTIQEPFGNSTMNLLAPLVVNMETMVGRQFVLPPRTSYGTKEPLFLKPVQVESGE